MLLTPAALWFVEKGRLPRRPAILAINNRSGQQCFAGGEKSAQALFMLFMTMPTMAETIAPDTPPPTSWPTRAPMSMPPVAPCSIGISEVRSDPPAAPPRAPAMVLPAVPRFTFFAAAPTALPPIAPAMSWMIRLIIVPDMGFPPLWPQNHMDDTAINRPEIDRLSSFLLCSGHKSIIALRCLEHDYAISQIERSIRPQISATVRARYP